MSLLILIISIILSFMWASVEYLDKHQKLPMFIWCFAIFCIMLSIRSGYSIGKREGAKEVYRGNTTLEILYRNNIPTDSIIIFK